MSEAAGFDLDPVTQEIFDLMRRQPGDTFGPEAVAAELGYPEPEISTGLGRLEQLGLVDRVLASDGSTYILSPAAPEL